MVLFESSSKAREELVSLDPLQRTGHRLTSHELFDHCSSAPWHRISSRGHIGSQSTQHSRHRIRWQGGSYSAGTICELRRSWFVRFRWLISHSANQGSWMLLRWHLKNWWEVYAHTSSRPDGKAEVDGSVAGTEHLPCSGLCHHGKSVPLSPFRAAPRRRLLRGTVFPCDGDEGSFAEWVS